MLKFLAYIFVSLVLVLFNVKAAKILAIFPYGPAHYLAVKPYLDELSTRGHNLVLISHYYKNSSLTLSHNNQVTYFDEFVAANIQGDAAYRHKLLREYHSNVTRQLLELEQIQEILFKNNTTFDMVIIDTLIPSAMYAIATQVKAHLVGISTATTELHIDNLVGNDSPMSFVPIASAGILGPMNFVERVQNFGRALLEWVWINIIEWGKQKELYSKFFPNMTESLGEICRNFSLILVNQHFSIDIPRPYVPNMVEVGGLNLFEKPEPMSTEIEDFIKGAKNGVIYFSMGTHIKLRTFPEKKLVALLDFFYKSKMRILWKFESPEMSGLPKNVMARNWFPQSAILAHPNVKLFITQGGFLSVMEAIYNAKPVVGIPVFYDHLVNLRRIAVFGMGQTVPFEVLSERNLSAAVNEVLTNNLYAINAKTMQRRFQDRPIKPRTLAIFWTEYILRHDGAKFMRVPVNKMSFIEYYHLDIMVAVLIFCAMIIYPQTRFMKGCCSVSYDIYIYLKTVIQRVKAYRQQRQQQQGRQHAHRD